MKMGERRAIRNEESQDSDYMKMRTCSLLGMDEEKSFIGDMRARTARGIWKGPD